MTIRGQESFSELVGAANLVGNFMRAEESRTAIRRCLAHACKNVISEVRFEGEFIDMFAQPDHAAMQEAAFAAEKFARAAMVDQNTTGAMISDAYSLIVVLCKGRLGRYSAKKDINIYRMSGELFALIVAADESN